MTTKWQYSMKKKSNDELFYVQDLRRTCPTCATKHAVSVYDDFTFHWLVPSTSMLACHIKQFQDQLADDSSSTIGVHAGCYSLESREYDESKSKYKIGSPMLKLPLDIDKFVSKHNRIFVNNLYENIHDRILPLPLGLFRKEIADFTHLRENRKEHFCYANFSMTINYRVNVALWAANNPHIDCRFAKRFPALEEGLDENFLSDEVLPFGEFLSLLSSYRFCIAPNGVGIDTDRLWECIYMNVVPVVQNNYGNRIFSKIWPMILVDRYEFADIPKLTDQFEQQYGENIQYNHDLLLRKNLPELLDRIEYECGKV
tara:strand:- start:456 stop:1397 length:942 start_codon:yes stop_codon:yes gene_type:complete